MGSEDPEGADVFFVQGQVGAGELANAARVELTRLDGLDRERVTTRWLLVQGPGGWVRFEDALLASQPEMHGHVTEHEEVASELVPADPTLGAVLAITIDRDDHYSWGYERAKARWYCFIREGAPTCVEVVLSFAKQEYEEAGGDGRETGWSRAIALDEGHLVIGDVKGDAPAPPAGRHALKDAAGIAGLVVRTGKPIAAP